MTVADGRHAELARTAHIFEHVEDDPGLARVVEMHLLERLGGGCFLGRIAGRRQRHQVDGGVTHAGHTGVKPDDQLLQAGLLGSQATNRGGERFRG